MFKLCFEQIGADLIKIFFDRTKTAKIQFFP